MSEPDRYAVIGHPVAHSRSPFIHERFARQTGQSLSYSTIDATPAAFEATVAQFFAGGGRGLNVTMPHNRTLARAQELAEDFADLGPLRARDLATLADEPFDIVINATSASITGDLPPLPGALVSRESFCYDMGYARDDTPFVRWAQQQGCLRSAMGLGMLVEQAAESFHLWRGVRPDTASVLAELNAALRAGH